MTDFLADVAGRVLPAGAPVGAGLRYHVYDPDRVVAGKRMEDQLRVAVCYWHLEHEVNRFIWSTPA